MSVLPQSKDSSHDSISSSVTITREEYEELLRDKSRLDYLETAHDALNKRYGTEYGWQLIINQNVVRFMARNCHPRDEYPGIDLYDAKAGNSKLPTCRDAIDEYLPSNKNQPAKD